MDVRAHNRRAWDAEVAAGNVWTVPVDEATVAAARRGRWEVVLTPQRPVPREWFGDLAGARILCLASGGGQQGPVLAAAGAWVTVFDNSPAQLGQDRMVAERDGLSIETVEGDMCDLSAFDDGAFDLIFHPVSNVFSQEIRPTWREAHRVLRPEGALLAGFSHPILFCFDERLEADGILQVKYPMPFSSLTADQVPTGDEPMMFGHSVEDQIGGQLDAGFVLTGFYEDRHLDSDVSTLYFPAFMATRAIKP